MRRVVVVLMVVAVLGVFASMVEAVGTARFPQSVASGDPRPDSAVLWTRVESPDVPDALQVEVATDEGFANVVATRDLVAREEYDYCVKVRVDSLAPYTTYYYRFAYGTGAAMELSPVGRTRTAPDPASPQPLRFAVAYCQDYIGRYYNAYLKMLLDHDEDLDFVVFLGDYIYETTGDPSFQNPSPGRDMVFEDTAGAIPLGEAGEEYYAASSLSNYRTLYRTYRSDTVLQQVHERWPMIVIWDDHEYSDDAWGATATYFGGRVDEYNEGRKRNAEQAFFEWIPIEVGLGADGTIAVDSSILYPNTRIYRNFQFGALLNLVMTDYRTYRPDHVIPENAFPGTIVLDEPTLAGALGDPTWQAIRDGFDPYVNLKGLGLNILTQTSTLIAAQAYRNANPALDMTAAMAAARQALNGNVSTTFVNAMYAAAGLPAPFTPTIQATLPRGLSYLYVGKQSLYGAGGSRYMVLNDSFNLLAGIKAAQTGGAAQNAFGNQQLAWLQGVVAGTPTAWRVVSSSVCGAPMIVDFTNPALAALLPPEFPDVLRTRLKLNTDQWDGFPHMHAELLAALSLAPNTVIISGDVHGTFVTDHGAGVFELTPPAISSATWGTMVAGFVETDPMLGALPGIGDLVRNYLGLMMQVSAEDDVHVSPSDIAYTATDRNGFMVVDVAPDSLVATIQQMSENEVFTSYYDTPDAVNDIFEATTYTIQGGQLIPGR